MFNVPDTPPVDEGEIKEAMYRSNKFSRSMNILMVAAYYYWKGTGLGYKRTAQLFDVGYTLVRYHVKRLGPDHPEVRHAAMRWGWITVDDLTRGLSPESLRALGCKSDAR